MEKATLVVSGEREDDGKPSGCGQMSDFIFVLTAENKNVRAHISKDFHLFALAGGPPGPAPKCGGHPHLIPEILRKAHSQQPVFYVSYASTAASPPLYILIIGTRPFTFASFQPLFPSFLHSSLCRTEMEQIKSKCLLLLRVAGRAWPVGVHQVSGGSGTYVKPRFIAP